MPNTNISRRKFIKATAMFGAAAFLPLSWPSLGQATDKPRIMKFSHDAKSALGTWSAAVTVSQGYLEPGASLTINTKLILSTELFTALSSDDFKISDYALLLTAERCFDGDGWMRLPNDERMSTLITPTGLAIEGGSIGAISKYAGSRHKNVIDQLVTVPASKGQEVPQGTAVDFSAEVSLPPDIPPGIYRLRLDVGIIANKRRWSLNKEGFGYRQKDLNNLSEMYSPFLLCSNTNVRGNFVDAATIIPKTYWVLLAQYNSNGYQGVVANEDKGNFALSSRNIIPDEIILPMYNNAGQPISYNLEPSFPVNTIYAPRNILLVYQTGEYSVQITDPTGAVTDLGTTSFTGTNYWGGPGTNNPKFTAWKPPMYGKYTITAKGWVGDKYGNRYHGGGTYQFWIAKRMTMGTATFQGMAYPVGSHYGKDIGFSPALPAEVEVTVDFYPDSDSSKVKKVTYKGKASTGGMFGAAQGMKPFVLDAPGEYHGHVLATYKDSDDHLWVCSMRHAGVVYPEDTALIAHGKKLRINKEFFDRGETHKEGYIEQADNFVHLEHINYPYNARDVLLIASEGQGANKIEPVLTYEIKGENLPYDPKIDPIGFTNVRLITSNGLSPHLYPEYITDYAYYYAAGPRPGLSSRFIVGEDGVRAPYWPTSTSNFGGQFGASNNGDLPGDIYRLIGGVVLRRQGQVPLYAGYIASAFILPKDSQNNRVIAPGSEDLIGADGQLARFFLVPVRPGMVYEQGSSFTPFLQIDPMVPATIKFTLIYPDGKEKVAKGIGDKFGSFVGTEKWPLDQTGVYHYRVQADYQGFTGRIPGLTPETGTIFVLEKNRPSLSGIKLNLKNQQTFPVVDGLLVEGTTTADTVHYAVIMPGAVIEQGTLSVVNGRFFYRFDPVLVSKKFPIYDIENRRTAHKDIGRIIHFTFFTKETAADGSHFHSYARIIMRGNTAIYAS